MFKEKYLFEFELKSLPKPENEIEIKTILTINISI